MKKKSMFILGLISLFQVYSCSTEEVESEMNNFLVDATATWESYASLLETPAGEMCPGCAWIAAGVFGTIESNNSRIASKQSFVNKTESSIILPDTYKVLNNPFECLGELHNRLLLRLASGNSSITENKLISADREAIQSAVNIYSDCDPKDEKEKTMIVNTVIENLSSDEFKKNNYKIYNSYSENDVLSVLRNSNKSEKTFLESVFTQVKNMNKVGNTKEDVVNYINSKISAEINDGGQMSKEKERKLVFLTTLKHSYYFWN